MKGIKNLSKKSAIPATNATKNQKQIISLTRVSTENGMYNRIVKQCYIEMCNRLRVIYFVI